MNAPSKRPRLKTLKPSYNALPDRVQALRASGWRTSKMTTGGRGYGYRWQKARVRHLQQHPLCVHCQAEGRVTAATIVDHKIPHRGDETLFWDETNWQSLCKPHHDAKTRAGE